MILREHGRRRAIRQIPWNSHSLILYGRSVGRGMTASATDQSNLLVAPAPLLPSQQQMFQRNGQVANSFATQSFTQTQYAKQHSTSTMDFVHSFPSVVSLSGLKPPARPATAELRTLFVASAIPMIGFGFMDQCVLIQAGGYIDATLGVSLGLATMTAAAAGQVVSDVSGVVFGGALERLLTRLSLIKAPNLTMQQRQLPICRNVSMFGAVVGVILGCALGATTLLTVDLEARHRVERAQRLRDITSDMILTTDHAFGTTFPCRSCTIYVVSTLDLTLPKDVNKQKHTTMTLLTETCPTPVQLCATSREIAFGDNRQVLYAPLVKMRGNNNDDEPQVLAVISFQYGGSNPDGFCDDDVLTCRVMAKHISIFMDRLGN